MLWGCGATPKRQANAAAGITAAIFGDAATRDADTGMRPLFYTPPLRKLAYLGGRFLGAFIVNATLLLFIRRQRRDGRALK